MSFDFTIPSEHRDFVEWHRGRRHYAVWALDLDLPEINSVVEGSQCALQDLLLPGYRRQAHVTLGLCGFPCTESRAADDYSLAVWREQLERLGGANIASFSFEIGLPHSFASAPYLTVRDNDGSLAALRRCFHPQTALAGDDYVPHLTLGLYRSAWPAAKVWQRLAQLDVKPQELELSSVHLMFYESRVIGGPLSSAGYFDLGARRWRSESGAAQCSLGDWMLASAGGK